jgi:hypothetical protein
MVGKMISREGLRPKASWSLEYHTHTYAQRQDCIETVSKHTWKYLGQWQESQGSTHLHIFLAVTSPYLHSLPTTSRCMTQLRGGGGCVTMRGEERKSRATSPSTFLAILPVASERTRRDEDKCKIVKGIKGKWLEILDDTASQWRKTNVNIRLIEGQITWRTIELQTHKEAASIVSRHVCRQI